MPHSSAARRSIIMPAVIENKGSQAAQAGLRISSGREHKPIKKAVRDGARNPLLSLKTKHEEKKLKERAELVKKILDRATQEMNYSMKLVNHQHGTVGKRNIENDSTDNFSAEDGRHMEELSSEWESCDLEEFLSQGSEYASEQNSDDVEMQDAPVDPLSESNEGHNRSLAALSAGSGNSTLEAIQGCSNTNHSASEHNDNFIAYIDNAWALKPDLEDRNCRYDTPSLANSLITASHANSVSDLHFLNWPNREEHAPVLDDMVVEELIKRHVAPLPLSPPASPCLMKPMTGPAGHQDDLSGIAELFALPVEEPHVLCLTPTEEQSAVAQCQSVEDVPAAAAQPSFPRIPTPAGFDWAFQAGLSHIGLPGDVNILRAYAAGLVAHLNTLDSTNEFVTTPQHVGNLTSDNHSSDMHDRFLRLT